MTDFDPFELEDSSPTNITTFRKSLVDRAKKRNVTQETECSWKVMGDRKLGDNFAHYQVTLPNGSRKYTCDCHNTQYGESRARRMCSHVMAVVLYKKNGVVPSNVPASSQARKPPDDVEAPSLHPALPFDGIGGEVERPQRDSHSLPPPQDQTWGTPPLPTWVEEFRQHQDRAITEIVDAYKEGADVVWLDAPTGSGKTLIAEAVRRIMGLSAAYICSSKSLQDQFQRDYPYAKVLKGRANYPTLDQPFPDYTCGDCTKDPNDGPDASCMWCYDIHACPYERAKAEALRSPLMILNTSYFLTEANFVGNVSGRGLGIIDECDILERELMGFVEYAMTTRMLDRLGINVPDKGARKNTILEWLEADVIEAVKKERARLPRKPERLADVRQVGALKNLYTNTKQVAEDLAEHEGNWVRDYATDKPFVLKPIKVDHYGPDTLWRHANKWLCMSATIISPEELSDSLGLTQSDKTYEVVRVPMTFPVENRRIHIAPVANNTNKEKEQAWPAMASAIRNVLLRHTTERALVHTVSYDFTRYLRLELAGDDRTIITYSNASERERAIEWFRASSGSVLLAPSLDRGIDLKHDDCRVIVVAKIPFPYLGDRQVSERMHTEGGQTWYSVQTVRSLVQMTGRGVRSDDDWCTTYVLDAQFVKNIWKKNRHLLPEWWVEAVDMKFPTRELLK